jgi:hypothetical protein
MAGMTGDHHHDAHPDYDPGSPIPPEREPPRRSTAPQSDYTMGQVIFGYAVLLVGLVLTFALPVVLG